MAGVHICFEQQIMRICFACAKPRDPLGRFGIAHLTIVETCGDEHRGIGFSRHIVVGRIRKHIVVFVLDGGIAPFVVLERRKWDGRVRHCGDNIDERRFCDDTSIEVGTQIRDRAHEQATGASSAREYGPPIGTAFSD